MLLWIQKKRLLSVLSTLFIGIIFISSIGYPNVAQAAWAPWVNIVGSANGIQDEAAVGEDYIIQKGKHNSADDNAIRYKTLYYYMTRDTYELNQKFTVGSNAGIQKEMVTFTFGKESDDGTTKKTEYIINRKNFMKAAEELGVTGDYLHQHGSASVYMHNVFQIFQGKNIRHREVYGYQEMLSKEAWSSRTREFLRGYYNYKYVISDVSFEVKVIAVDEDENILDDDLLGHEKYAIYNETIPPYTLEDEIIEQDGAEYQYDHWEYTYKDRESEKWITKGKYSGQKVSFSAPDAEPQSTLTVKMVFKEKVTNKNYPNTLYYVYDNETKEVGDLAEKKAGETLTWNSKVLANPVKNYFGSKNEYHLKGYYIKPKDSKEKLSGTTSLYTKDGASESEIINGNAKVVKGGLKVYLLYSSNEDTPATPTPAPEPSTTPSPTPTPRPLVPPVEVPQAAAPITLSYDSPAPYGVINGDKYAQPFFESKNGVSTTESQHVYVKTKDYLLGYSLVNRTGKVTYVVPVTMNYILNYYTATPDGVNGGKKPVVTTVPDKQYIEVERAYSYWEIENLEYYNVSSARVSNYSLPGGSVSLTANNSYLNLPSLVTSHSADLTSHVLAPVEVSQGITLSKTISSEGSSRPVIDYEDLSYYALTITGENTVINDSIVFDGQVVMSNKPSVKFAAPPNTFNFKHCKKLSKDKALFTENEVIEATKKNGVYLSNGIVTYQKHPMSVSPAYSKQTYPISVNQVTVHTPVICKPVIYANNDQWTQLLNPTADAVEIVLDPDSTLNDFTVRISNTLLHSHRIGYYTRDFSRSFLDPDNISYIAKMDGVVRNEMKLPFDVYIDTKGDGKDENDKFIKSGTWIVLGRSTHRFYVPMWVQEGTYTAKFRTVAVNGTDKLDNTEVTRNSGITNYVATATQTFEISGRMYGLTLYDVSDELIWNEAFRTAGRTASAFKYFEGNTDGTKLPSYGKDYAYYYTVGPRNQYGLGTGRLSKYTVPLVDGSHPRWKNRGVLKTGYAVRFCLDTIGELYSSGCKVMITPRFYYVDKNGNNRQQIDLYYKEEINNKLYLLAKVGHGIDLVNIKKGKTDNPYSKIPDKELRNTAAVLGVHYSKVCYQQAAMYSYSDIRLLKEFRTFVGTDYASHITSLPSWKNVKEGTKATETELSKYQQRWYGTYKLPNDIHAVKSGYDVYGYMKKHGIDYNESFWLTEGYIIVNFDIVTIDKNGKKRLSYLNPTNYLNNGNCSMWVTEGGLMEKKDRYGATFNLKAGDFIFYYTDKKASDDYAGDIW